MMIYKVRSIIIVVLLTIELLSISEAIGQEQQKQVDRLTIIGSVTYLEMPVPNVNVYVEGSDNGVMTDELGKFEIMAEKGDVLVFSHVSYKTKLLSVTENTSVLNINLESNTYQLDEVIVATENSQKSNSITTNEKDSEFTNAQGKIDPKRAGYSIDYFNGEEINTVYSSLREALLSLSSSIKRINGVYYMRGASMSINNPQPIIWDVDGMIYTQEPPLDIPNVQDIHILPSLAGTQRYGNQATGGVIVVRTKLANSDRSQGNKNITKKYTNRNYYDNNATEVNIIDLYNNSFTKYLNSITDPLKAKNFYNDSILNQVADPYLHLKVAMNFLSRYNDIQTFKEILDKQTRSNSSDLKLITSIAYLYQATKQRQEAIRTYQYLYGIAPNRKQSFRDLANALVENNGFQKAWRIYMSYLIQGNEIAFDNLGEIVYSEMENLFFNRKEQSQINQEFVPRFENVKDFRNDIRLVFEWNDVNAHFDIEFVDPSDRSFKFEHTPEANRQLIEIENEKGYSSKEFFIDKIGDGEWLINLSYKGDKSSDPTFFKITTYYNWGSPSERNEIITFPLINENKKIQITKINRQLLLADY